MFWLQLVVLIFCACCLKHNHTHELFAVQVWVRSVYVSGNSCACGSDSIQTVSLESDGAVHVKIVKHMISVNVLCIGCHRNYVFFCVSAAKGTVTIASLVSLFLISSTPNQLGTFYSDWGEELAHF